MHIEYGHIPFLSLQVMTKDLGELGYVVEHSKIDAQDYLLPQRRNRVYALADINAGQCSQSFAQKMKATMESMASDVLLPFDSVFDTTLPHQQLEGRQYDKLQEALEKACLQANCQNVFVDTSTSSTRECESATNVLTCVRPTHKIYSHQLQRFVTIQEMWAAQGLFKCNFENQEAVQSMWEQASKAQDLAGNAFASTCMQAKIVASLVHGQGWINLAGSHGNTTNALQTGFESGTTPNDSSSQPDFFETPDAKGTLSTASSSERGIKRKSSSDDDDDDVRDESVYRSPPAEASASSRPQKRISLSSESIVASSQLSKRSSSSEEALVPLPPPKRRCVGKTKQSDAMIVPQHIKDLMSLRESNRKKGPGRPKKQAPQDCEAIVTASNQDPPGKKGNDSEKAKTARDGKQSVISIWDKMKLFEETRLPIYMHIYIYCICIYIYITYVTLMM